MTKEKSTRAVSLDAFRGLTIALMVFSGAIASWLLPAWMCHAQVPPGKPFDPSIPGITWVDLIFPFFLFAMGASFPFSVGRRMEQGQSKASLVLSAALRYAKLAFFAIFINHFYSWNFASPQTPYAWAMSILGFALLFPAYTKFPYKMRSPLVAKGIEILGFAACIIALLTVNYAEGRSFSLSSSNIIILLLANMAFFGTLIYIFTKDKPLLAIAVLPFVMGILLSTGDWQGALLNWSPAPWLFRFMYLKYLFIVIPGSIAGEYLRQSLASKEKWGVSKGKCIGAVVCALLLVGVNLWGLYWRHLVINLFCSVALLAVIYSLVKENEIWKKFVIAGAFLLLLGLFFENFEGGIKKDHSTFSYYFVTAGLAFICLLSMHIVCDVRGHTTCLKPFSMAGQNPMIAYVATNLFVLPVLHLSGAYPLITLLETTPLLGVLRGVVFTAFAVGIADFFTYIKWYWRT